MKAVIVAGGLGTRLRPITDNIPKPLIEVKGKPIVLQQIEWLKKYGIKDILITTSYKHEKIINYLGDGNKFGVKINYFIEEKPMGTAGAFVLDANRKWLDDDFIIISGDIITNLDIRELFDFHRSKKSNFSITLQRRKSFSSSVKIDSNNTIISFVEKPKEIEENTFSNASIYLIDKDAIKFIKGSVPLDFSKDIFPALINNGFPIFGYVNDKFYWREVGSLEKLNLINNEPSKAVFIDIDGILCEKALRKGEYIDSIEKFKWKENAKESIKLLSDIGFYIFPVTNKACINKGIISEEKIREMYSTVFDKLPIKEIFICPHRHDEQCSCRKPRPGLIDNGLLKYNLDSKNCWVVGDNDVDVVCGESAGCKTILVGSDGIKELEMNPNFSAANFAEAAKIISDCDGKN